jgi:hypothetical protein
MKKDDKRNQYVGSVCFKVTLTLDFIYTAFRMVFTMVIYSTTLMLKGMNTKTTAPADSHMVSHCSTSAALTSLTLEIERDPVFSGRYGRS